MIVSARSFETILVWASQVVVNGPTKSRVLARCANYQGPVKYGINSHIMSKHDVSVKRWKKWKIKLNEKWKIELYFMKIFVLKTIFCYSFWCIFYRGGVRIQTVATGILYVWMPKNASLLLISRLSYQLCNYHSKKSYIKFIFFFSRRR